MRKFWFTERSWDWNTKKYIYILCWFHLTTSTVARERERDGWMDERCFRPLLCTVKAELGLGQPGLMRWIWDETLPQRSIDRSTFYSAAHRATKWAIGRPQREREKNREVTTLVSKIQKRQILKQQWRQKAFLSSTKSSSLKLAPYPTTHVNISHV